MNLWLSCVIVLTAFMSSGSVSSADRLFEEPTFESYDVDPCIRVNGTVNRFKTDIWIASHNYSQCTNNGSMMSKILRVHTESENASVENPLVFVTRMGSSVQTWHLPLREQLYSNRIICSDQSFNISSTSDFPVYMDMSVSTNSIEDVEYSFEISLVQKFDLELWKNVSFNVSPTSSEVFHFKIPDKLPAVKVVVSSATKADQNCAIVSVQKYSCPVNDQVGNVRSESTYQTMITSASLTVTKGENIPGSEFFIVVVSVNKSMCSGHHDSDLLTDSPTEDIIQSYSITVKEMPQATQYIVPMVIPAIIFIAVGLITSIFFAFPCFHCFFKFFSCHGCLRVRSRCYNYPKANVDEGERSPLVPSINNGSRDTTQTETEHKNFKSLYAVYGWNTCTVGIFYGLPAFQLVLSEQLMLDTDGDQDTCYYNFKCAQPLSVFSAFNNVWSNIGYVFLGVSFLIIVAIRNYKAYNNERKEEKHLTHGVSKYFGVYYAMGAGLVMEGFMSAFYHICPSNSNFQFDTAFMFIIGGLLIIKILQSRQPEIHAKAFIAFFSFAVLILITFIGIWGWSRPHWQIGFTYLLLLIIGVVILGITLISYYSDKIWKIICPQSEDESGDNHGEDRDQGNHRENTCKLIGKQIYRHIKVVVIVILNIALCIVMVQIKEGIASVVLSLILLTFFLLLIFYVVTKIWYREWFTLMPVVFFIILLICWVPALYFFSERVTQSEISPAKSREKNADCYWKFYDNHDIWHFLSATALFFSYLFLLTLDDGTEIMKKKQLKTF